jgi:nucleotide-binding universal stress UspA family protein
MPGKERMESRAAGVICVPVDFEPASLRALEIAEDLAACMGAEVILVHVCTLSVQVYPGVSPAEAPPLPGVHLEVEEAARRALGELAAAHGGLRSILLQGDPADAILEEIGRLRPRMVVMGTHGRSGLRRLMLGSVAEKIVRGSPTPVTVVRAG